MKAWMTLLLCACTVSAWSQSESEWFARGNAHYNAQQYDSARVAYTHALSKGPHFASEYNLGNVYFRLGEYPNAILHWERAARLQPGDPDVAVNLTLARARIFDDLPEEVPNTFAQRMQSPSALNLYSWLAIGLAGVIGLCVILRTLRPSRKRSWTALTVIGALLLALVLGIGLWAKGTSQAETAAILMAPKVDVYTAPDGNSVSFVLHAGTKVELLEVLDSGWIKVEIAGGEIGWMRDQGYTPI